jgi:hypothetical protein
VNLNASTGAVAGTPTATYTTANVVFSVQDAHGVTAGTTSTVSFTVVAATPSITAASTILSFNLTVGTPMVSLTPITASGGATPYTYYVSSGTLPAGLSLDASTGAVTGTPSAIYTAAVVYFSVKDANNVVASAISRIAFQVDVPAGYVYDGGLIWGQASPLIGFAYAQAASLCSSSTSLGLTGWRLPTGRELTILAIDSMAIPAYPLLGWTFDYTWSSDSTYGVGWHDIYDLTQGSIGTQMQDTDGNIHLVTCVH